MPFRAMVCSIDHLASQAGVFVLRGGGNAVDAAIATNAVLAVTSQHMCGLGGDLFALIHRPGVAEPLALNASGRSGSGADSDRLRAEGFTSMPAQGDVRSVTVPGCVDGWAVLHDRLGRLPLAVVLEPAIHCAKEGFPASPLLAAMAPSVAALPGGEDFNAVTHAGATVRRTRLARALECIASSGREGFYEGDFGRGLIALGAGEYDSEDLLRVHADWVEPLGVDALGHRLWTVPPNSQGYLVLSSAWIANGLSLPEDSRDPRCAHLLIEAARLSAYDRLEVLNEHADGQALLSEARLGSRRSAIRADRAASLGDSYRDGDTTYLCVVDTEGCAVSLIQSNAAGFGSGLVEPSTGAFLHNRGIGFSLEPGHSAEYGPGRRPPHTLSPLLVTTPAADLRAVIGTMGGDSQPQILLQLLDRILRIGEPVAEAVAAPRWILQARSEPRGFDTWDSRGTVKVTLEPGCPDGWLEGLTSLGHQVAVAGANYGHAHAIACDPGGLAGAADPRSLIGEAAGF